MADKQPQQILQVLPVVLTADTDIYNYKGQPIIGGHYPVTKISEKDNYGYINEPMCQGPLRIEFTVQDGRKVALTVICEKCGLTINSPENTCKRKSVWFSAVDRWLIDKVEPGHESPVSCEHVNFCIGNNLEPNSPVLIQPPIILGLIRSEEVYRHATLAYSRVVKDLLQITRTASDDVRKRLGYK